MKAKGFTGSRRRLVVVLVGVLGLVIGGTVWATAASRDDARHPRSATDDIQILIAGQSTGGGCRMGYDTQTTTNTPPDDSTSDNLAAATVNIRKVCPGAVIGSFAGEISTPAAGDFIHIDMRATCTGTGGMAAPCTVGQTVFASPGHTFAQTQQSAIGTKPVTMVWTGLPRGLWRFEVLPGGDGTANLQFRTFVVEAFNGG